MPVNDNAADNAPWYSGITRYQWLVLVIASLGWVFDVFEGQIFVASMNEAMKSLAPASSTPGDIQFYNNISFGTFLVGGALGGVLFGMLADRWGRTRVMVYTIIVYSLFTCVSAAAQSWWHFAIFRFLVALGVGGEWAVASALVAEVFPRRARAWSLGIFHASSVLGTMLAIAAGYFIVGNPALQSEQYPSLPWRVGFLVGVLPALLIIWIRLSLKEPERPASVASDVKQPGQIGELFTGHLLRHTIIGVGLAAVGLATFWGVHIYGKDLMRADAERTVLAELATSGTSPQDAESRAAALKPFAQRLKGAEMVGMLLVTIGGGMGLVSFGPLCDRLGRRAAFLLFHLGGLIVALVVFRGLEQPTANVLFVMLPIFGFLTLGMHAGYAIYFPELYPTRLRSTGAGFCFNVGRIIAAPCLFASGWLQSSYGFTQPQAVSFLSLLYLVGVVLLLA
ncbi:MAG: MFS transporter, partial [Planctomycetaceae bacterium]|nr:MFS transporter [Planctomycetaceae bacterium]